MCCKLCLMPSLETRGFGEQKPVQTFMEPVGGESMGRVILQWGARRRRGYKWLISMFPIWSWVKTPTACGWRELYAKVYRSGTQMMGNTIARKYEEM